MKKLLILVLVAGLLAATSGAAFAQGVLYSVQAGFAFVSSGEVATADIAGMIDQLDPDTGDVINSFELPYPPGPCAGLAYACGRLFYQSCGSDIYELDPDTGAVLNTIPFEGPQTYGLGFSCSELFVLTSSDNKVSEGDGLEAFPLGSNTVEVFDPNTGDYIRTITLPLDYFFGGLSYGRGSLFLNGAGIDSDVSGASLHAGADGLAFPVYEIDAQTGDLINEIPMPEPGVMGAGYSSARGSLFVGTDNIFTIYELDPDTGAVINSFPGNIFALAADEAPALAVPGMDAWGMAAFALLAGISAVVILRRKSATA